MHVCVISIDTFCFFFFFFFYFFFFFFFFFFFLFFFHHYFFFFLFFFSPLHLLLLHISVSKRKILYLTIADSKGVLEFGRHAVFQQYLWKDLQDVMANHGETAISWARSSRMEDALKIKTKLRSLREERKQTKILLDEANLEKDEAQRTSRVSTHKAQLKDVECETQKEEDNLVQLVLSNVLSLGKIRVSCKQVVERRGIYTVSAIAKSFLKKCHV